MFSDENISTGIGKKIKAVLSLVYSEGYFYAVYLLEHYFYKNYALSWNMHYKIGDSLRQAD